MTTSTAGGKKSSGTGNTAKPASRPSTAPSRAAAREDVYVGQTFRMLRLTAGVRPFAVVVVHTDAGRASGWLMVDPQADAEDPLLKELGVQAADRKKPCYITVPTDWLK